MSIYGIHQNSKLLSSLQSLLHDGKAPNTNVATPAGNTRQQEHVLLSDEGKDLLVGDSWPIPLSESARAYAPRSGTEAIKATTAELLRAAQAIPREDITNPASQEPQREHNASSPPSLDTRA